MNHSQKSSAQSQNIAMEPVAVIHSCFTDKFGIPRQPGLVSASTARLEMLAPCNRPEALEGLLEFSHIWIFFLFHKAVARGWKPTVRPPRLGGNKRMGVFASRSPQRPNFIGNSVVKLEKITSEAGALFIHVSGIDILDQTPVLDIKPYIPYSDAIPQASCGYAPEPQAFFEIVFTPLAHDFCKRHEEQTGDKLATLISQVLNQDPRPAYQHNQDRQYGMTLWGLNIRFSYHGNIITVDQIQNH